MHEGNEKLPEVLAENVFMVEPEAMKVDLHLIRYFSLSKGKELL